MTTGEPLASRARAHAPAAVGGAGPSACPDEQPSRDTPRPSPRSAVLGRTVEIAGVPVQANRMLRALRQMSLEIYLNGLDTLQEQGGVGRMECDGRLSGGAVRPSHRQPQGTRGAQMQAAFRRRKRLDTARGDVVGQETGDGEVLEAQRSPGRGNYPRANRIVKVRFPEGPLESLTYAQLPARLTRMRQSLGPEAVSALLADILRLVRGSSPAGGHPSLAFQLASWLIQQEGHRNVAAMSTHGMIVDMMSQGRLSAEDAVSADWMHGRDGRPLSGSGRRTNQGIFPMQPRKSQNRARLLSTYLDASMPRENGTGTALERYRGFAEADRLARRELRTLSLWPESPVDLGSGGGPGRQRQDTLILEVRRRVLALYGERELTSEEEFLAALDTRMHLDEFDAEA